MLAKRFSHSAELDGARSDTVRFGSLLFALCHLQFPSLAKCALSDCLEWGEAEQLKLFPSHSEVPDRSMELYDARRIGLSRGFF
jgi:hypothetical protein